MSGGALAKLAALRPAIVFAAAVLLLAAGAAGAKGKNVRPDEIADLQKSGKLASFDKLNHAVLAKHPGGHITDTSLSRKDDRYDYKVRITDANGDQWKLKLDGGSAAVLTDSKLDRPQPPVPAAAAPPPANAAPR